MTDQQTGLTLDAISIFEKCELKRKKKVYVGLSNEISINITILGHSTFDRECLAFNFFMLINHINLSNFKADVSFIRPQDLFDTNSEQCKVNFKWTSSWKWRLIHNLRFIVEFRLHTVKRSLIHGFNRTKILIWVPSDVWF